MTHSREIAASIQDEECGLSVRMVRLERENRKLGRDVAHLKNALVQEKMAATTLLNQHKASTFIHRERERYPALLLANSPNIILFLSPENRIEFCTEYFIAKAGFNDATEVQGHAVEDILAPFFDAEAHETLLERIQAVPRTNTSLTFNTRFYFDREGSAECFAGLLVPMKDARQHSNGIMLMFHDVTDLKRSREEALAASKAKSAFLSNMSHEIRTPMNAIIGMTAIGMQEQDPQRKNYAFGKIETASTHLLGIINDILDISKIEAGKMEVSPIVFSFTQMLDRVLSVCTSKIRDKQQHFTIERDPNIPDTLFGDDQHLAQVITNLLSNATKFTPEEGSVILTATALSLDCDACVIRISVKDSGIGMSEEEQAKLFNAFQQAQVGTTRKYGGSGLGLALSKRILELMGGEIWVESETGNGSCFSFTVPLGIPKSDITVVSAGLEAVQTANGTECADFSGKVILLVDDIDINLEIAIALLEPTQLTIDTAQNGQEAVDAFAAAPERYDAILMDVQMPEMDGLQATAMIRQLNSPRAQTIPIIAMTANVFTEDIQECMDAGMDDHLGKPMILQDVILTLSHYLLEP